MGLDIREVLVATIMSFVLKDTKDVIRFHNQLGFSLCLKLYILALLCFLCVAFLERHSLSPNNKQYCRNMTMQELIYLIQGSNDLLEMGNFLLEDKSVAWCLIMRSEVCLLFAH